MRRTLLVLSLVVLATCSRGAPPGFSGGAGDRWTFPLVGPLEDGLLLTPVTIGAHGPFLFAIDPDAPISVVDGELVKQAELRPFNGPNRLDETDTQQPRIYAEIVGLEIGSLIIERRNAIVVKANTFDVAGRRIHGIIGRDVLADSLVFGIDRDRGLGHLMTLKAFQVPAEAIAIQYAELNNRITNAAVVPPPRRLAKATIVATAPAPSTDPAAAPTPSAPSTPSEAFTFHLDLGATVSQLRDSKWERAKLVAREVAAAVIDEIGTPRRVAKVSEPVQVTLGAASSERVAFVPYDDRRWDEQDIDGTLGLGFFAPYDVWVHWDAKTYYLKKRTTQPLAARIGRWQEGPIDNCQNPGCLVVRLVDPMAGKTLEAGKPHPGVVLSLTREEKAGGMDLEVVLEAQGKPELPRLIVNLPPNVDRLIDQLDPAFLGATLVVVDASPYPRKCPGNHGCVDKLAR